MKLHYFPQDYISNGRGAETKLSKSQQINAINVKIVQDSSCAKPMNPKGENLGTCSLEGIKGSLAKPSKVGLNFNTWLGVLNPTSWGPNVSCNTRIPP